MFIFKVLFIEKSIDRVLKFSSKAGRLDFVVLSVVKKLKRSLSEGFEDFITIKILRYWQIEKNIKKLIIE